MGFACDFEGAGFVLKLPVLIISNTKFARHKKTNSPSSKGEWLKAEGVKTHNTSVVGLAAPCPYKYTSVALAKKPIQQIA